MDRADAGAQLSAHPGPTAPAGPPDWPPRSRWPEPLHRAVAAVRAAVAGRALPLVALSGGADSAALAVAVAEALRTGPGLPGGAGAVVVDHGLQAGSARVARDAAALARRLGLDPVTVETVEVTVSGSGPEADARAARHAALAAAAARAGSQAVLLAHTRDDQAEQVLLGLARGSGTRSLAGMPPGRGLLVRPLLGLGRRDTEAICRWAGIRWWEDPANADPAFLRSRVRTLVLPLLEDPRRGLGPGVAAALARSAEMAAEDADALDQWAAAEYTRLAAGGPGGGGPRAGGGDGGPLAGDARDAVAGAAAGAAVALPLEDLAALPDAVRRRVIGRAVVSAGGERPSRERVLAVDALVGTRSTGGGSAGPVELAGGVTVRRRRRAGYARLVFYAGRPSPPTSGPDRPPASSR
ncbi:tRNA lysidine(34) synthetase TilS [Citricoccus sp. SGAir0253]|uniref:tRNA lysidine(34) synthetase TilS n=1 Tax=Citricoccus sp. SGAir0253 TaxID=2567881 RepID=UPI0010CD61E3|nr:tRNA lysidine(34) synthetase TilS [Citricoccus sp. SGAir0253]QCU76844.1 tRNA lysidine(34) synthetase TilS [Citricoccus sp. SGAir0253]